MGKRKSSLVSGGEEANIQENHAIVAGIKKRASRRSSKGLEETIDRNVPPVHLERPVGTPSQTTNGPKGIHILKKDTFKKLVKQGYLDSKIEELLEACHYYKVSDLHGLQIETLLQASEEFRSVLLMENSPENHLQLAQLFVLLYIGNTLVKNIKQEFLHWEHWTGEATSLLVRVQGQNAPGKPGRSTIEEKGGNLSDTAGTKTLETPPPLVAPDTQANETIQKHAATKVDEVERHSSIFTDANFQQDSRSHSHRMSTSPLPLLYNPNHVELLFPPHPLHYSWDQ